MAAIPASAPLGEQLQHVLKFLKSPKNRRPCSFVEIAVGTGIPIVGNRGLIETLQQNPKVELNHRMQTARYVSAIVLDDAVDMLNLIAKSPRGLSAAELEDAYPHSAVDLERLAREGKCIRIYSADRQSGDRIFPRLGADPYEGVGMAARGAIDHRLVVPVGSGATVRDGERTLRLPPGSRIGDEIARGELILVDGKPYRISLEAVQVSRELKKAAERALLAGDTKGASMTIGRGMVADPEHSARELERGRQKAQPSLTVKETGGHFGATATGKHQLHQSWMYAHHHGGPDGTVTLDRPFEAGAAADQEKEAFDEGMRKAWGGTQGSGGGGLAAAAGRKRPRAEAGAPSSSSSSSGSQSAPGGDREVQLHRLGCSLDIRALWRQVQRNCSKLCRFQYPTDVVGMQRELERLRVPRSLSLGERVVKQRVAKMRRRGGGGGRGSVFDRAETRHLQGTAVGAELEKAREAVALRKQQEEEARWEEMQRGEEAEARGGGGFR